MTKGKKRRSGNGAVPGPPVYLVCERRAGRAQMKQVSVCHRCSQRGRCAAYRAYLQPDLWGEQAVGSHRRPPEK